jgi:dTDP-4-amino-4,6-dideoxygalactose transaminase
MTVSVQAPSAPMLGLPVPLFDAGFQNRPLKEEILAAIGQVVDSGRFIHGPECSQLEAAVANYCGVRHAIGCASGSDALLLAMIVLGVGPGDEVILPSFTFFATAGAVWRVGARPVFVDIDAESFAISAGRIGAAISEATRAIVPVHLFGQCADMSAIRAIADAHKLAVVEDVAQAIGSEHGGRRAGSMGTIGCLSFYPTKNLGGMGDGGMLLTNDAELERRLRVLCNHGQQPAYHHVVVGMNSRLDAMQAAILGIKLKHLETWVHQRTENARRYARLFRDKGLDRWLRLPGAIGEQRVVWNQYTIRVPAGQRDALARHLSQHEIGTAVYYPQPLHLQPCFASLGYREGDLPETEQAAREVLSLPIFPGLSEAQQRAVVQCIRDFYLSNGCESLS